MANTYIPDRWLDKLDKLPAKDYKILLSAIFRGEDEPEISGKYQHIADEIYTDIIKKNYHKKVVNKSRNKVECDSNYVLGKSHSDPIEKPRLCHGDSGNRSQLNHSDITVTLEEKKEKESPPSPPSSSPSYPLNNTPYNPPLEREKREDSPSSLTLTNPQGGDISSERAGNTAKIPLPERFDKLWEKYPRKIGKKRAFDAYKKAIKSGTTDEVIADGIERYRQYVESRKFEEKYIKQGSTWFAGECWNDEYDISARQLTADEEREYQELWGG